MEELEEPAHIWRKVGDSLTGTEVAGGLLLKQGRGALLLVFIAADMPELNWPAVTPHRRSPGRCTFKIIPFLQPIKHQRDSNVIVQRLVWHDKTQPVFTLSVTAFSRM